MMKKPNASKTNFFIVLIFCVRIDTALVALEIDKLLNSSFILQLILKKSQLGHSFF
jgi:hypothetical protein